MRIKVKSAKQQEKKRTRVCVYVRVSTDILEDSLENQTTYFRDYIQANPEWELIEIYADKGRRGFMDERPGFQRMLRDARQGKFDLVMVKSISRFARNTVTVLKATRELKQLGIGVYFQLQGMNTLSTAGELMLTIRAAFAQAESEAGSDNLKMVYRNRFSKGIRHHRTDTTYGYQVDQRGRLCIDESKAPVVQMIYDLAEKGIWANTIKDYINQRKIPAPMGGQWDYTGITRVLRNVMYKGDLLLQKRYRDAHRKIQVNRGQVDQWYIQDDHPAIIVREQWDAVQAILDARRESLENPTPLPTQRRSCHTKYPLAGLLFCPYCGNKLIHKWCNKVNEYWACKTNLKVSAAACKGIYLPVPVAEGWDIHEPVVVMKYQDEYGMDRYTAIPKEEYDGCPDSTHTCTTGTDE